MNFSKWIAGLAASLASLRALAAGDLTLTQPRDYEVVQRFSAEKGTVVIAGEMGSGDAHGVTVEARVHAEPEGDWHPLPARWEGAHFATEMEAPAGGWYRLEVRAMREGKMVAEQTVEHVGVGEVFVVAGQSNSANYGEEKQSTQTGRVVAFNGNGWQLANDPEPGAAGTKGSLMPPLGTRWRSDFTCRSDLWPAASVERVYGSGCRPGWRFPIRQRSSRGCNVCPTAHGRARGGCMRNCSRR